MGRLTTCRFYILACPGLFLPVVALCSAFFAFYLAWSGLPIDHNSVVLVLAHTGSLLLFQVGLFRPAPALFPPPLPFPHSLSPSLPSPLTTTTALPSLSLTQTLSPSFCHTTSATHTNQVLCTGYR
jgi:hypothetical protein